jgi:dTMP kinase
MANHPLFVTIDGPNGVGKTSIVAAIVSALESVGVAVLATREPTTSALGRLCRSSEDSIHGRALACLVAADRYAHIEREIVPALKAGTSVVCDRYIESSLVLQALDGVETAFIWSLNQTAMIPDLSIELIAAPDTILKRRTGRTLTRFEREHGPTDELSAYQSAGDFLMNKGYHVHYIDADRSIDAIVQHVIGLLQSATPHYPAAAPL